MDPESKSVIQKWVPPESVTTFSRKRPPKWGHFETFLGEKIIKMLLFFRCRVFSYFFTIPWPNLLIFCWFFIPERVTNQQERSLRRSLQQKWKTFKNAVRVIKNQGSMGQKFQENHHDFQKWSSRKRRKYPSRFLCDFRHQKYQK